MGKLSLPPSQEDQDEGVYQHEACEHEELAGLLGEGAGLGDDDDDDVAAGHGEEPGRLHDGLHAGGGLAVGELEAGDAEHDLGGRDDEVLRELPEDVDAVGLGEGVEGGLQLLGGGAQAGGDHEAVHAALLQGVVTQVPPVHQDPKQLNIN